MKNRLISFEDTEFGVIPAVDGKRLASKKDPLGEAVDWVCRLDLVRNRLVILGLAGAYHIEALLEHHPERELIVIEENHELVSGVEQSANVRLFSNRQELLDFLYIESYEAFQIVMHPRSYAVFKSDYDELSAYLTGRSSESSEYLLSLYFNQNCKLQSNVSIDRDLSRALPEELKQSSMYRHYQLLSEILR